MMSVYLHFRFGEINYGGTVSLFLNYEKYASNFKFPTKTVVARDDHWLPRTTNDGPTKF